MLSRRTFIGWPAAVAAAAESISTAPAPHGSDDTGLLQNAVDRLPSGGVLEGGGREYIVARLRLKSRMTLRNFRLRAKGTATPLDAVVTIDGNAEPAHDIVIRQVHVEGSRVRQSNLASEEDGGRDGFRIVGKAERLLLDGCSAVNCATDGLKIFSHRSLSRNDASLNFHDLYIRGCRFLNNRRHGASGDSLENVYFTDCEFSGNGMDVPGGKGEGARAALDHGMIYGSGIDIEGYGAGSGINGLYFLRCKALGNARFGFQFWEPTPPGSPGFLPRRRIVFDGCMVDGGVSPRHGHQALELSQPPAVRGARPTYEDVRIVGLECNGTIILNGVHNVTIVGGSIRSPYPGFWGIGERCRNVVLLGVAAGNKIFAQKN